MPDPKLIQHYRTYMRMYASMMFDLSKSESYIAGLIKGENRSDFEQALRRRIEKLP